jgi:hypothetical protein
MARAIFSTISSLGFAYDVEFLIQARRSGAYVVEIPVQWHYARNSSMRLSQDTIEMFKELLHIFVRAQLLT